MKKLFLIALMGVFLVGCAGFDIQAPVIDKTVLMEVTTSTLGYLIGKKYPEIKDTILKYSMDLMQGEDADDFKLDLNKGTDWLLNELTEDPYLKMQLVRILPKVELKQEMELLPASSAWMERVKGLLDDFIAGLQAAS